MRDAYNEQLRDVLEKLMEMGGLVESMLDLAVADLAEHGDTTTAAVHEKEERVNLLQNKIDDECVNVVARQQPVAGDLRFVFIASRAANDLERVGDQAVNIIQNAKYVRGRRADQDSGRNLLDGRTGSKDDRRRPWGRW